MSTEIYFSVEQLVEEGIISPDFANILSSTCIDKHCKYPIYRNRSLTRALCLNPECPLHMKFKASSMLQYLKVTGIAEQTCYNLIIQHKLKSHLELIPLLFKVKPKLELWEVAKLCFIPDVSDEWNKHLKGCSNIDKVSLPSDLQIYRSYIKSACKYFDVKEEKEWLSFIDITVHGSCGVYGTRYQFVDYCNSLNSNNVYTTLKTSTTRSCKFVVTEQLNDLGCNKIQTAMRYKTPVITPQEYMQYLISLNAELLNRK